MKRPAAEVCADLGIKIVPPNIRRRKLGELETCCEKTIDNLIEAEGESHVVLVLKTLTETTNNRRDLIAPTVYAVSDVILAHPKWIKQASIWFEAFDGLDIPALRLRAKKARVAEVRRALATLICDRLMPVFEAKQLV